MEDHCKVVLDLCKELRKDFDILMAQYEIVLNKLAAREGPQIGINIFGTDAREPKMDHNVSLLITDNDNSDYICIDNSICGIEVNKLKISDDDGLSSNIYIKENSTISDDKEPFLIKYNMEWDGEISFDYSNYNPEEYDNNQHSDLGFVVRLATSVADVNNVDFYIHNKVAHKLVCESAVHVGMDRLQCEECKALCGSIGCIKGVCDGSSMVVGRAKRTLWDPGIHSNDRIAGAWC